MGIAESLLVGIACAIAQGGTGAKKVEQNLTVPQKELVQFIRENRMCEAFDPAVILEKYLKESESLNGNIYLMGCGSCLQTSTGSI